MYIEINSTLVCALNVGRIRLPEYFVHNSIEIYVSFYTSMLPFVYLSQDVLRTNAIWCQPKLHIDRSFIFKLIFSSIFIIFNFSFLEIPLETTSCGSF